METLFKRLLNVALILGIISIFFACGKEKPTLAKIRVIDINSNSVSNARVVLCPCPDPQLAQTIPNDTAYTDQDGWANFDYTEDFNLGTAGFRILDIYANAGDTLFGTGIIKVMEQKENIQAVVVSAP